MPTTKRGGSRTLGKTLRTNTSGLAGIRFAYVSYDGDTVYPYIHVSAGLLRTSISVDKHGVEESIRRAAHFRAVHNLPHPSREELTKAYDNWKKKA